ncbi:MAG: hypothetical protein JXB33_07310 [Clostridia bacterium]|nr:hypothetical protein [Clostridia bacterium]
MIKKTIALAMSIMMLLSFASCAEKEEVEVEFGWGTLENGHYVNEFFNFSIEISPDYTFLSPQEIVNMNTRPAMGDDGETVVDPVDITTIGDLSLEALVNYVYATKYKEKPEDEFNPYISVFSENMKYVNNTYDKEDYVLNSLNFTKSIFSNAGVGVEVLPLEKPWIDGRQFAKGVMRIQYEEFSMYQVMYAITKGSYALVVLAGYSTDEEKAEIESFIDSIRIN